MLILLYMMFVWSVVVKTLHFDKRGKFSKKCINKMY